MRKLEVENFPAHKQRLTYQQYLATIRSGDSDQGSALCVEWQEKLQQELARLNFTCKVSVIAPHGGDSSPAFLSDAASLLNTDTQSYIVRGLSLDNLINYNFTQSFVKTGEVLAMSYNTDLGVDNSAMLTPQGRLSLLLNRHSYFRLGLTGKPSTNKLRGGYASKYAVHINSLKNNFYPGRPNYTRATDCLGTLRMDVWLTWKPYSSSLCPSSIAKYFVDLGFKVELLEPSVTQRTCMKKVQVPLFEGLPSTTSEASGVAMDGITSCDGDSDRVEVLGEADKSRRETGIAENVQEASTFLEVIGCYLLNINPYGLLTEELCGGSAEMERLEVLQCEALYTSHTLYQLLTLARSWLSSSSGSTAPWLSLVLHSHPEVPFQTVGPGCAALIRNRKSEDSVNLAGEPVGEILNSVFASLNDSISDCSRTRECYCKDLQCGCGMGECDSHMVSGGMVVVVITRNSTLLYRYGSASTRHRYFSKTSNNK